MVAATMPRAEASPRADPHQLSALVYTNGFTLWHYKVRDPQPDEWLEPGYFVTCNYMLLAGDKITVSAHENLGNLGPARVTEIYVYEVRDGVPEVREVGR